MAYREFVDGAGARWRAWDTYPREPATVRARFAGGWLGFESGQEHRRLHPVPAGWAEAGEAELCRWLAEAEVMPMSQLEPARPRRAPRHEPAAGATAAQPAEDAAPSAAAEPAGAPSSTIPDRTRSAVQKAREVIRAISDTIRGE